MLEAELVHPAGETGVRESGFCDERGELAVGGALRRSFRHQLYGLLPSGPGGQPLWNGANLAGQTAAEASFASHSSDRVRIGGGADGKDLPGRRSRGGRTVARGANHCMVTWRRGHPPAPGAASRKASVVSELRFVRLGFGESAVDYQEAWQKQREVHAARFEDTVPDTCLLLEHPPVYTAGRRTTDSERPLDGTPVVDVDRGGKITWHGPGQLVGYPIQKLPRPVDVVAHVRSTGGRADPYGRRVRPGDHPGRGSQRGLGAGRPGRGASGARRPVARLRSATARRGVRPAAERPRVRPVQQPASAARTASWRRSASGSPRA